MRAAEIVSITALSSLSSTAGRLLLNGCTTGMLLIGNAEASTLTVEPLSCRLCMPAPITVALIG